WHWLSFSKGEPM
nr:mating pheromone alpha sk3 [Lachancea kluyveri]